MPSLKKRHTPLKPGVYQLQRRAVPQSVRTSFRFSAEASDALAWMAKRFETTQKHIIATVVHDLKELRDNAPRRFQALARTAYESTTAHGTRRAYVVPRNTLDVLHELASDAQSPRDALLESALYAYFEATKDAEDTLRSNRGHALNALRDMMTQTEKAANELDAVLDKEDPIRERFDSIAADFAKLELELRTEVEPNAPVWGDVHSDRH